jgi:AraC-like DNA-binding protein
MARSPRIRAWKPGVPGVTEVFHARFTDHAYPPHTHATWTLLIVDDGAIRFDLDLHHHGAVQPAVTLLPPHVPHDGRAATTHGFHKRVLYLDTTVLGPELIGRAVDRPSVPDPALRNQVHRLHLALDGPGEELAAETGLVLVAQRLRLHLRGGTDRRVPEPGLAERLRDLLDAHVADGITLRRAGAVLGAHPAHLIRTFRRRFGLPPHAYLTGRRVDLARRLLLDGVPPASAATTAGFHDQAHLTRHFKRYLATTPGRYRRAA